MGEVQQTHTVCMGYVLEKSCKWQNCNARVDLTGKMGLGEHSHTKHDTLICKLMINKHQNICVGASWNDVCVHG